MIIVIVGPTGVGKTKLSIELAKKYNAEIINADSMQVYKKLDIGTAKVLESEKENIPHHLFDICDVTDMYTVYDYQKDARNKLNELLDSNKNVIIVGGTGLYIKALLHDYRFKEETSLNDYSNLTNQELYDKVLELDKECDIHINNRKRLERRLNVIENDLELEKCSQNKLYDYTMIGLTTSRDNLYNIINNRVDKMISDGLINEVKYFYDKGIKSKAIDTGIGYKELYKCFDGEITKEEAIELIKKNSRHYAKRQYTFFNNQFDNINWIETDYNNFNNTVEKVINIIEKK